MARPYCPLCQDNLSVVPVRAVYQYQMQESEAESDTEPSTSPFRPPEQLSPPGRYAIAAAVAGLCVWLVSGFTFLCLAISLCLGIFVEFIAYLDSMDARAERREALRRWYAAYYCGAHDAVFLRGAPTLQSPAAFARQMQPDGPAPAAPAAVATVNS
jgi:ferric-dicitrate binding protein FerR (iron transport regulator)